MGKTILHFALNISSKTWLAQGIDELCADLTNILKGKVFNTGKETRVHLAASEVNVTTLQDADVLVTFKPGYSDDDDYSLEDIQDALNYLVGMIVEQTNETLRNARLTKDVPSGEAVYHKYQFWLPADKQRQTEFYTVQLIGLNSYTNMERCIEELDNDD